jgi:hypothetical protein
MGVKESKRFDAMRRGEGEGKILGLDGLGKVGEGLFSLESSILDDTGVG